MPRSAGTAKSIFILSVACVGAASAMTWYAPGAPSHAGTFVRVALVSEGAEKYGSYSPVSRLRNVTMNVLAREDSYGCTAGEYTAGEVSFVHSYGCSFEKKAKLCAEMGCLAVVSYSRVTDEPGGLGMIGWHFGGAQPHNYAVPMFEMAKESESFLAMQAAVAELEPNAGRPRVDIGGGEDSRNAEHDLMNNWHILFHTHDAKNILIIAFVCFALFVDATICVLAAVVVYLHNSAPSTHKKEYVWRLTLFLIFKAVYISITATVACANRAVGGYFSWEVTVVGTGVFFLSVVATLFYYWFSMVVDRTKDMPLLKTMLGNPIKSWQAAAVKSVFSLIAIGGGIAAIAWDTQRVRNDIESEPVGRFLYSILTAFLMLLFVLIYVTFYTSFAKLQERTRKKNSMARNLSFIAIWFGLLLTMAGGVVARVFNATADMTFLYTHMIGFGLIIASVGATRLQLEWFQKRTRIETIFKRRDGGSRAAGSAASTTPANTTSPLHPPSTLRIDTEMDEIPNRGQKASASHRGDGRGGYSGLFY